MSVTLIKLLKIVFTCLTYIRFNLYLILLKNSMIVDIEINNLIVSYDSFVLLKNINFKVDKHDIFIIMGSSGCGKTSLLNVMTGLKEPTEGNVLINGKDFWKSSDNTRNEIMKKCGILYQSGALFSSMTLAENIALPLEQYTEYSSDEINDMVYLKLALVGLAGFENFYPSEISGGMKKRAGFARALALDPKIVYFDEPSAGLDPISSKLLDDLIIEINQSLGTTIVVITHELNSIFKIGTNSIFLDNEEQTITGYGNPKELLRNPPNQKILNFLTRGEGNAKTA
jgi:phospholipid/cholesterol/gamma-HCH transport system ATP-binding protein